MDSQDYQRLFYSSMPSSSTSNSTSRRISRRHSTAVFDFSTRKEDSEGVEEDSGRLEEEVFEQVRDSSLIHYTTAHEENNMWRKSSEQLLDSRRRTTLVDEPSDVFHQNTPPTRPFQLPTLLVTSTPSTVFDSDGFYNSHVNHHFVFNTGSVMSGLTFQLQSGIHKKSISVEAHEIALRDLRNEAFQFVKEIYPEKGCETLRDHILLYKHDLRSINILQLISTASDVTDGTLVEVVIGCELVLFDYD